MLTKIKTYLEVISPENFFSLTAVVFGLLFIIITPPFEAPDEPVHFFRAYQVSTLNLSVDKVGNTYGGLLPTSLQKTITITWDDPALAFHPDIKYPLHLTREALHVKNTAAKQTYDFSTTAPYSPVSYIPQALGVGLGRLINAPPVIMMYLGRLFNLTAWVSMFYLAISLMPRKKWAFVFIGLIPMALFQAASLSSDVMAIGLLAIVLGWLFRLMEQKERLSSRQLLKLVGLLTLLALSKQIMFLFVPLILLLPGRLFKNSRTERVVKSLLVMVPILLFGLWMLHIKSIPLSTSVGGVDPPRQIKFMLSHPLHDIKVAFNTYFLNWGDGISRSFFGNFGWVDTPLSEGIVALGYVALFILLAASPAAVKPWLSKRSKLIIGVIALAYLAAVTAALYAYFTPVAFNIVVGLVGRYYYPLILILVPLFWGDWLRINRLTYRRIAIWSPIFLLACSMITIFIRYYVHNV